MKFGFVTCVQLGLSCMEEIYKVGGHLDLIITLPDDQARAKSGRVWLDSFADSHGVTLVKSPSVNDQSVREAIVDRAIDWLFIIGWSQIAKPHVLEAPRRGVLGMHPTLLPVGRGRAAIPWAIIKGLRETGVTLFQLDAGVDTGPVLAQYRIQLDPRETATTLYDKVERAHRTLIRECWDELKSDRAHFIVQDESLATCWPGRRPEDGELKPSMCVEEVDRLVRATTHPYPGAYVRSSQGKIITWEGKPLSPGTECSENDIVLAFSDGDFLVQDHSVEPRE